MKPKILLFCAEEGKQIASAIGSVLEDDADLIIWDDSIFDGKSKDFIDAFVRKAPHIDLMLVVLTADDATVNRRKLGDTAIEGLIFELGMGLGLLGTDRIYILGDGALTSTAPSFGISVFKFNTSNTDKDYFKNIQNACKAIKKHAEERRDKKDFRLLPSFALAVGYFYNFVLRICKPLIEAERIKINYNGEEITLNEFTFNLTIIIPHYSQFKSNENLRLFEKKQRFQKITLFVENESFYNIKVKDTSFLTGNINLDLFDIPNNLSTSNQAINFYLQQKTESNPQKQNELLESEVDYFKKTLLDLLSLDENKGLKELVTVKYSIS